MSIFPHQWPRKTKIKKINSQCRNEDRLWDKFSVDIYGCHSREFDENYLVNVAENHGTIHLAKINNLILLYCTIWPSWANYFFLKVKYFITVELFILLRWRFFSNDWHVRGKKTKTNKQTNKKKTAAGCRGLNNCWRARKAQESKILMKRRFMVGHIGNS